MRRDLALAGGPVEFFFGPKDSLCVVGSMAMVDEPRPSDCRATAAVVMGSSVRLDIVTGLTKSGGLR